MKVAAVAVNPIDTYVRSGAVAMTLPTPFIVGCDLAGTVEAVGEEVTAVLLAASRRVERPSADEAYVLALEQMAGVREWGASFFVAIPEVEVSS